MESVLKRSPQARHIQTPLIHVLDQDVSGFLNVVLMFLNKGANIEACFIRLSVVKAKEVLQVSL